MAHRALVVVRGGDKSLHLQWWCAREQRSFDIALSYFGNNPEYWKKYCDFFHYFKGSKWQGLYNFINNNASLINKYDYVWFPDDDLWMHIKDLEKFFEICRIHNFTVAQPALMPGSFYSWPILLQKKYSAYRKTNFVEVMAPCFRTDSFKLFSATFGENTSGWGLEWLWWRIAKENNCANFAVIDLLPMLHVREVASAGSGGSIQSPIEEMNELFKKYNLTKFEPETLYTLSWKYYYYGYKYLNLNFFKKKMLNITNLYRPKFSSMRFFKDDY